VKLVSGKQTAWKAGHLEGHAPKTSLQAFLPSRQITADRGRGRMGGAWRQRGTPIALTATADRAGTVRTEVTLD
jgi:hypothetical protein